MTAAPPVLLHVCAGNLYGGIETFLSALARERPPVPSLVSRFAVCHEGRLSGELRSAGADVHLLGPVRASRPWTVLRARRRLAEAIGESRPAAVAVHGAWPAAMFAPVPSRLGVPLLYWAHGPWGGGHWLERWASLASPRWVVANSRHTAESHAGVFPGAVRAVIHYPVAPPDPARRAEDRRSSREEFGAGPETAVIFTASRMEAWKGHALLIEALARLDPEGDWACWIAGGAQRPAEREYEGALKARAAQLPFPERVRFLGQRSDVSRLLAGADIHCQPNTGPEPFGIVFVEALFAGLPVVSTAMGGALEIVTPECGDLVEPRPEAVAAALDRLLRDPAARARLGAGGPARAKLLCDPADRIRELGDLLAA